MRRAASRLALTLSALLIGAAAALAVAAPAQANAFACTKYLTNQGYAVSVGMTQACRAAQAGGKVVGYAQCYRQLQFLKVAKAHADKACTLGYR
ncbi:hypothetical protein AB0B28_02005 [Glycomyces sp. NPDC046736]|uniref:hypothetical protein n=1 Tax=Glycomyces sp. NPDC046736 TaxID=3155615 RepID=UPI0033C6D46D